MMTSMNRGSVMGHHSHLKYLHILDFTQLLVDNQSLTTVWLSHLSIGLVLGRPGLIPSHGAGNLSAMLYNCCVFHVIRI